MAGVRNTANLATLLAPVIKTPDDLKVGSTDPSDPARMELVMRDLESVSLEGLPPTVNKKNHAKARLAVLSALIVAAVGKYNLKNNEYVGINSKVLDEFKNIRVPSGSNTFKLIDILPKDEDELKQIIQDAKISPRPSWILKLSSAGVTMALLAGCARGNDVTGALVAGISTATPTTEVTPPPTLTAPTIEPTPKASAQPTQWLPTPRAVEPTAKPTEKPRPIELPAIEQESVTMIESLNFNMEVIDPKAVFRLLLEPYTQNQANKQFFGELGIKNYEDWMNFVRNNVGGPENKNYWFPLVSPNGTGFKFFMNENPRSNIGKYLPIKGIEGVYLDGMYSMIFFSEDLKTIEKSSFINSVIAENNDFGLRLVVSKTDGVVGEEFGLLIVNNRLTWVSGNTGLPGSNYLFRYYLGGEKRIFNHVNDPKKVTAMLLTYLKGVRFFDPKTGWRQYCTYERPGDGGASSQCSGGVFSGDLKPEELLVRAVTN